MQTIEQQEQEMMRQMFQELDVDLKKRQEQDSKLDETMLNDINKLGKKLWEKYQSHRGR